MGPHSLCLQIVSVMMSLFGYERAIYIDIQITILLITGKRKSLSKPCTKEEMLLLMKDAEGRSNHVTLPQTKHILLTPKNKNKSHAMIQCNNMNFTYIPTLAPCEPPFTSTPSYTPPYPSTFISLSPNSSSCSSVLSYSSIVRLGSGSGA